VKFTPITLALVLATFHFSLASATPQNADLSQWDEAVDGPLPRWREGGTPEVDPQQVLYPRELALSGGGTEFAPGSGLIASPPEYDPADGVLFRYSSNAWPTVVRDCVAALTGDPGYDEIAYVVVSSASQRSIATGQFVAAGADMSKVQFFIQPTNSIWLRDYGPHFAWQGGTLNIVDSHYYPTRSADNFIPTILADDEYTVPSYDIGLYYSGGNFQPGPSRMGFVTSLIQQDNPGFSEAYLAELYSAYQGIDALVIFPRLPSTVDGTGHLDMWLYLVDENTVIISEFLPGSNATAISITDNAALFMQARGFTVVRVPAWNAGGVHYTYTNAYRVNDRIFVPIYGPGNSSYLDDDQTALSAWQTAAGPGVVLEPINCYSIIPASGAIHCIVMQVPRYTEAAPSAHVVSPDGGEFLVSGTTHDLQWAATDDVDVSSVSLSYSTDGGATFPHIIASGEADDGHYSWTVPTLFSSSVHVRVEATDAGMLSDQADSETALEIGSYPQTIYDYSTGAGTDKWAWGYRTSSWSQLTGTRRPAGAGTEIDSLQGGAYGKLATSDATGGDSDTGRYRSPIPSAPFESTHVFELTIAEDPATIIDIGLEWEGYGDDCVQAELYIWDDEQGDWGDGRGLFGENRYVDNFAGNRDAKLAGHIKTGFERYLRPDGVLTLLLYAERSSQETFHDYVAVTVTCDLLNSGTFCDASDSTLGSCPCANPGLSDTGCEVQQATGGVRLDVLTQETMPLNRATVTGTGFPVASTPTAIVIRATGLDTGSPVVFGDGLRCIGTPLVRLAATFASGGRSIHTHGHGTGPGSGTFYYQLWFRNTPIMFCDPAAAFNLSSGRTLVW